MGISSQELRIGNWYIDEFGSECQATTISKYSDLGMNCRMAQPIPLTEEWMLKLGFRKGIKGWFKTHDKGHKFNLYMHHDSLYKSVHQLQNLYFALTGQELEIKK